MLSVIILYVIMQSVMLTVVMLTVIMLTVIMFTFIMLSVLMLSVIMQSDIMPTVVMLCVVILTVMASLMKTNKIRWKELTTLFALFTRIRNKLVRLKSSPSFYPSYSILGPTNKYPQRFGLDDKVCSSLLSKNVNEVKNFFSF
jgi:hypothetical protein